MRSDGTLDDEDVALAMAGALLNTQRRPTMMTPRDLTDIASSCTKHPGRMPPLGVVDVHSDVRDYETAARCLTSANDLAGGWRSLWRRIRRALGR